MRHQALPVPPFWREIDHRTSRAPRASKQDRCLSRATPNTHGPPQVQKVTSSGARDESATGMSGTNYAYVPRETSTFQPTGGAWPLRPASNFGGPRASSPAASLVSHDHVPRGTQQRLAPQTGSPSAGFHVERATRSSFNTLRRGHVPRGTIEEASRWSLPRSRRRPDPHKMRPRPFF